MINGFTPTEKRILALLSDGNRHTREEVLACLDDDLAEMKAIKPHVSRIRKKLNLIGEEIVCVARDRSYFYQHVRLLPSAYDGRS